MILFIVHCTEYFNAAHKLYNSNWTEKKNKEFFGLCANENWHGHNFELMTSVKGEIDPETGLVIDLKKLSELINQKIIEKVDHQNINLDVSFMEGKMGSCENLVIEFWNILEVFIPEIAPNALLYRIRLFETPRNFVDYYGD